MTEDLRCCGTGTCLINAEGACWCGQRWDGANMCFPEQLPAEKNATPVVRQEPAGALRKD